LGFVLTSRAGRDLASIQTITGVEGAEVEIAYLSRPDNMVELIQYNAPADQVTVRVRPCDVGFAHIEFDVRDIDAVFAHLAAFGAAPIAPPFINKTGGPNAGVRVSYLARSRQRYDRIDRKICLNEKPSKIRISVCQNRVKPGDLSAFFRRRTASVYRSAWARGLEHNQEP
jgi:hypothetical protein